MEKRYNDEITIDLMDMVFFFLKKWKSLLALLMIFSVLMGGFAVSKNAKQPEATEKKPVKVSQKVQENMVKAAGYRRQYEDQKKFNEESLYMQLDANNLYSAKLRFLVEPGDDLNLIRTRYNTMLDDELMHHIQEVSGYDVPVGDMAERVTVSVAVYTDEKEENPDVALSVLFSVVVDDRERCEAMMDVIRESAEQLEAELSVNNPAFSALKVTDTVRHLTDGEMIASQATYNQRMVNYLDSAVKLESAFSQEEKKYYEEKFLGMEPEEELEEETSVAVKEPVSVPKYVVVGALLGIVLWGGWNLVAYFANTTVKTAEELTTGCGITLLGRVSTQKKGKGVTKLLQTWEEKFKRPAAAVSYLTAAIDGAQEGQAVLCGGCDEAVQSLMKELEASCGKVRANGFISENEEALKLAKQVRSEILVIQTWKTRRAQVLRELDMCRLQDVKVLGMIVID